MGTRVHTENLNRICPDCGRVFEFSAAVHSRKLECPKCHKLLASTAPLESESAIPPPPLPPNADKFDASRSRSRIDMLEARIAALEETLKAMVASTSTPKPPPARVSKLKWVLPGLTESSDISPEKEVALFHNLTSIPRQRIAIFATAGDQIARERAEWFRKVFDRAQWTVEGPTETNARNPNGGLLLGVATLPVAPGAAATYLALRAAGFPATPVLDPDLATANGNDGPSLSLTTGAADPV